MGQQRKRVTPEGLSVSDAQFCRNYVENGGNGKCAYKGVHPNVTDGTATVKASQAIRKVNVRDRINKVLDKLEVTEFFIVNGIKKIASKGKVESNRLRALEDLGRFRGMDQIPSITNQFNIQAGQIAILVKQADSYLDEEPPPIPPNSLCGGDASPLPKDGNLEAD